MPTYQRGDASIYYEDYGSGFPLLLISPGGMNSAIAFWGRMPFNPIDTFRDEFRVIAMDQRNCGQSVGPVDTVDPWASYVDDQLGLLNHLGIDRYLAIGCCIGCSYLLKQSVQAPGRMLAGVLEQPIGLVATNRETFQDNIWKPWGEDLAARREDVTMDQVLAFGQRMWGGDFVFSVPKDTLRTITTPFLVLPGIDVAHPTTVGREVAELLPNSQILEPWKSPPEIVPRTVEHIRDFLQSHLPAAEAACRQM